MKRTFGQILFVTSLLLLTILLWFLVNWFLTKNKLPGTYVSRNNVNTIDTLIIFSEGKYQHTLYRMQDKSLIYKNTGTWTFSGDYITFNDFYCDEDDIHSKEEGEFEKTTITTMLPIETRNGKIIFHHLSMYDNVYLEKIN